MCRRLQGCGIVGRLIWIPRGEAPWPPDPALRSQFLGPPPSLPAGEETAAPNMPCGSVTWYPSSAPGAWRAGPTFPCGLSRAFPRIPPKVRSSTALGGVVAPSVGGTVHRPRLGPHPAEPKALALACRDGALKPQSRASLEVGGSPPNTALSLGVSIPGALFDFQRGARGAATRCPNAAPRARPPALNPARGCVDSRRLGADWRRGSEGEAAAGWAAPQLARAAPE